MTADGDHRTVDPDSEYWRSVLTGEDQQLVRMQKWFRNMPKPPRCKLCYAPFAGMRAPFLRLFGFRRWELNQAICSICMKRLEENDGGAEIPVSLLFADVRGSTTIAEDMPTTDFTDLLGDFYRVTAEAIDVEYGVVDHLAGDGVMAMWIPGFVGADHPQHAVAAARRIASGLAGGDLPIGVGVHTGDAYVGVIGREGTRDFTVLGDAANTTARLSSAVGGGEIAVSDTIAEAAGLDTSGLEHRELALKGKTEPVGAWIERLA